ncbi:MAG TPA: SDR family oxidoreductase [Actinomycetota bacterium]|nr:SDR family oxidoreductase [Actinomycetota bacterium]
MNVSGANVVLTGASRGIGAYLAEGLARRGAHLALVARSEAELTEVANKAARHGRKAIPIVADVTKRADLKRIVSRATKELGSIDILINNAGRDRVAHFPTLDLDEIESMFRLNVIAVESLTRLVLPEMIARGRGHILNMSSLSGKTGVPYMTVYSSTKHALVGFSWSLRAEMKPYGIGVSVVCPGFVRAGLFARWNPDGKTPALSKPVSPERVVDETIKAIEKNKAEVIVAPGLGKTADINFALSPDFTMAVIRKGGVYNFLRKVASKGDHG